MTEASPVNRFRVLYRTFVDQFFTSQTVTSDLQLHQSYVWILIFLLVPGAFFLLWMIPEFQTAAILIRTGRQSQLDDLLAWVAFFLTTYSMVAVGFVTVLAWDGLTFSRRDALVLAVFPLPKRHLLGAKLAALTMLLMAISLAVGAINALAFALVSADRLGASTFVTHFVSMFVAASGSGAFIFAAIVTLRGIVSLVGGPAIADACGPPLQFLCVLCLLCLTCLSPAVWEVSFVTATMTGWMPSAWFLGVFEWLRHSSRAFDPAFPFHLYLERAAVGTVLVSVGALGFSVVEFIRQMRAALAPSAAPGLLGAAYISRALATMSTGRSRYAGAVADFALLTLARSRAQQAAIALHAAVGAALVVVALSRNTERFETLLRPRTAVLWIPLVMSYWIAIGLRAAFFRPSELPAAWSFRMNAPSAAVAHWSGVRAAMIGFVLPRTGIVATALVPILGWSLAFWNGIMASLLTVMAIDLLALTVRQTPFTRPYEPGRARMRTRWPFYVGGLYVFAYWPAHLELLLWRRPGGLESLALGILGLVAVVHLIARWIAGRPPVEAEVDDDATEPGVGRLSVLDLAG